MNIAVTEAKAQLTELVRRAEAGEEIVLTRHGRPAVQLQRVQPVARQTLTPGEKEARYRALMEISRRAAARIVPGPAADDLYNDDGLPV